jgi:hypothetical protein
VPGRAARCSARRWVLHNCRKFTRDQIWQRQQQKHHGGLDPTSFRSLIRYSTTCATLTLYKNCWVTLGVSLLMLNWYLCVRNTNCPQTPISRPEEKRGDPRATIPLTSSNYSEGPVSTQFLLCDGMLTQVPIL